MKNLLMNVLNVRIRVMVLVCTIRWTRAPLLRRTCRTRGRLVIRLTIWKLSLVRLLKLVSLNARKRTVGRLRVNIKVCVIVAPVLRLRPKYLLTPISVGSKLVICLIILRCYRLW